MTSIAKIRIEQSNFLEAVKILDDVISRDSTNKHAYFYRGHSKLKMKDFNGAKDDFDLALKLSPKMTQAYNERALALISIFETTHNAELLTRICNDLETVQTMGDSSVASLHKKYCIDK